MGRRCRGLLRGEGEYWEVEDFWGEEAEGVPKCGLRSRIHLGVRESR